MITSICRLSRSTGLDITVGAARTVIARNKYPTVTHRRAATKSLPSQQIESSKSKRQNAFHRFAELEHLSFSQLSITKQCTDFIVVYNPRMRVPDFVIERLTREHFGHGTATANMRAGCSFFQEKGISPQFRSTNADYKGSGYDRGHLAPVANHCRSPKEMKETFSLINVAPQVGGGFNRGLWSRLEEHTKNLVWRFNCVYICTGTLFLPKLIGDQRFVMYQVIGNGVAVPTHFFKVAVGVSSSRQMETEAYIMPNEIIDNSKTLHDFKVKLKDVENYSGLSIFSQIKKLTTNRTVGSRRAAHRHRHT